MATEFSVSPNSGQNPLTVTFTDLSSPVPTSWLWDFGDGSVSNVRNPTHVYSTPGTFTVTLTANGVPLTKTNLIAVTYPPGGAFKVKVQNSNIYYSTTDPSGLLNVNIKGQLSVDTEMRIGNSSQISGTITTDPGQDLTLSPLSNLRLRPGGRTMLNNTTWPVTDVIPGQFVGSNSANDLAFINFVLATGASDNLFQADLNTSYPTAKTGQWVVGTATTNGNNIVAYQKLVGNQWLKVGSVGLPPVQINVIAAGTTIGTARPLIADINVVSTVSANQGVSLPTESAGKTVIVINTSTRPLKVYPSNTTASIDLLGAGIPFVLASGARIMFVCVSASKWYALNASA